MRIQLRGKARLLFSFRFLQLLCAVLIVGTGIATASAYTLVRQRVADRANLKFEEITNSHVHELFHSFETYSNALYATRGLFAGTTVRAETWDSFINAQNAPQQFKGMKALAYAEVVPHEKISKYEYMLRDTQNKNITVRPVKKQGDYVVITYHADITPGESARLNALGFDLTSDPTRRDAITRANRSNTMAATGLVSLATNGKTGFLFILPLTDRVTSHNSSRPFGYSIAAFDLDTLISTTIGTRLAQYKTSMEITDITEGKDVALYRNILQDGQIMVSRDVTMRVADRVWKISFKTPGSSLTANADRFAAGAVLVVGTILTIVICIALYSLRLRSRLVVLISAEKERSS